MRPAAQRSEVLELVAAGLNDCEIARRTRIPRSTIREWRAAPPRTSLRRRELPDRSLLDLPAEHYAYVLAMYLGDGYLAPAARGVFVLRVYLDNSYPSIINECARSIEHLFPGQRAGIQHHAKSQMVIVTLSSKQWPRLLPQHGPGKKHTRPILLTDWQRSFVEQHPGRFLRGLIHSDGWRGNNRVRIRGTEYVYPRYQFCNLSDDILGLFGWCCDLLGVSWRRMNHKTLSVARRASVAILDEFIGPKG